MTTLDAEAVAALLAELQESPLPGARYAYTVVKRHTDSWTLARRSERDALVAAIPEDPRCADYTLAGECHWCGAALDDGDSHDPTCRWVKARAAIEGGRT